MGRLRNSGREQMDMQIYPFVINRFKVRTPD